jgi:tetraacyldisaccharide 4'-kinase
MSHSFTPFQNDFLQPTALSAASLKLEKAVSRIMLQPGKAPLLSWASLLLLISLCYGCGVKLRRALYAGGMLESKKLPCKVISVGNITLGGTGKSPMTIFLAKRIQQMGYRVVVCSRGYGGRASKRGGIVSDGHSRLMSPEDAGDEPVMMAANLKGVPVVVGKDRFRAGEMALKRFKPDVLVLDDAYQHLRLIRDINLLLMDSSRPLGNGYLFPRGVLREPASSISRGDAIILTRFNKVYSDDSDKIPFKPLARHGNLPLFKTSHIPKTYRVIDGKQIAVNPEILSGQRVLAFSGIAGNDDFKQTIEALGCQLAIFLEFPDHYWYSDHDIRKISSMRTEKGAAFIMTTQKDFARIHHRFDNFRFWLTVGVDISFLEDDEPFTDFLKKRLNV